MKSIATVVLASVGLLATATQAFFAWAWTQTDARKQFIDVFQAFYDGVPEWTALMFGLGGFVWLLPAISAVLMFLALRRRTLPLSVAATLAVAVLVGMTYAMYPVHVMLTKSVI